MRTGVIGSCRCERLRSCRSRQQIRQLLQRKCQGSDDGEAEERCFSWQLDRSEPRNSGAEQEAGTRIRQLRGHRKEQSSGLGRGRRRRQKIGNVRKRPFRFTWVLTCTQFFRTKQSWSKTNVTDVHSEVFRLVNLSSAHISGIILSAETSVTLPPVYFSLLLAFYCHLDSLGGVLFAYL